MLKNIRSRYVCKIISRFKFSYAELLWFKDNFPRVRRTNKLSKMRQRQLRAYIKQQELPKTEDIFI